MHACSLSQHTRTLLMKHIAGYGLLQTCLYSFFILLQYSTNGSLHAILKLYTKMYYPDLLLIIYFSTLFLRICFPSFSFFLKIKSLKKRFVSQTENRSKQTFLEHGLVCTFTMFYSLCVCELVCVCVRLCL